MKPKSTWRTAFGDLPPAPHNPLAIIDMILGLWLE